VPLAIIVVIGLAFYLLGGQTRWEPAAEPVTGAPAPVDHTDSAP
jgi:hypothetical protein